MEWREPYHHGMLRKQKGWGLKTDNPLKWLTNNRPSDILAFLGIIGATILRVETPEIQFGGRRLDNVLHLRSPNGQEYYHILEWQNYNDPLILWRLILYMALLAMQYPNVTIIGTVIYVSPKYDKGDILELRIDGQAVHSWNLSCIRL